MKHKLSPRVALEEWEGFCSRFHFPKEELPTIQGIYTAMLPLAEAYAYYSLEQDMEQIVLPHYAYGLVTLGKGVDELAELYLKHEKLQEAYIVDCISLLLLSSAYEELAHEVEKKKGLYLSKLTFLGDAYPVTLLPRMFQRLMPDTICLTEGQMLKPLKTAALILQLEEKPQKDVKQACNTCTECKNFSCPARRKTPQSLPRTYGAMQIFHIT